jgi:CBS domain containing-hemolysin-like protein
MNWLSITLIVFLILVETLAAYITRIYAEYGKILSREVQENLDAWEELVEPSLGLTRDHASLCAVLVRQLALGLLALEFGALLFDRGPHVGPPDAAEISQAILTVVLVIVFCNRIIPALLFNRTRGRWVRRIVWPVRIILWLVTPFSVIIRFFDSVAALGDEPAKTAEEAAGDVEALLEAGEEEGILEETDRDLVRSAVEFGDKLVREVMTPRPRMFVVRDTTTIEDFLVMLKEHNYSRVPVFHGTIDNITGIAFSHDLLQITDEEARTRTVSSIQRLAAFVPETKKGNELLREMQREQQHMRIVIDEYGGVAGLVTIEDLLEQIVGEIRDEHDDDAGAQEPQRAPDGAWVVPGAFAVDQLGNLFDAEIHIPEEYEATTVGGLVSELEGRIPHAGEVVVLEPAGLRMEVAASTDRRVERVRVFPPAQPASGDALEKARAEGWEA